MTEAIKFSKEKYKASLSYDFKPVLNVVRISCLFSKGTWTNRLFNTAMSIKIFCSDDNNREVASDQDLLVFGGFISAMHKQPVLEINRYFKFSNDLFPSIYKTSKIWRIDFELNNIDLGADESIVVDYIDSKHILERIDDWKIRIENLYSKIESWTIEKQGYHLKTSYDIIMYEEMMKNFELSKQKIKSADLFSNDKLILTLKPFGLWIIGANGRVDIISKKGNFILVDYSSQFQEPDWRIYLKNKKENLLFDKNMFQKIIEG
jgi:hypothetical protein